MSMSMVKFHADSFNLETRFFLALMEVAYDEPNLRFRLHFLATYVAPIGVQPEQYMLWATRTLWETLRDRAPVPAEIEVSEKDLWVGLDWIKEQIGSLRTIIQGNLDRSPLPAGKLVQLDKRRASLRGLGQEVLCALGLDEQVAERFGSLREYPHGIPNLHLVAGELKKLLDGYAKCCFKMAENQRNAAQSSALMGLGNSMQKAAVAWQSYEVSNLYFLPPEIELIAETATLVGIILADTEKQETTPAQALYTAALNIQTGFLLELLELLGHSACAED